MIRKVKRIDPLMDPRWDNFIRSHPLGSIYQSSLWQKVVQQTYGYLPLYFILEDENASVLAAFPLFFISSRFTGKRFVSLPFSDFCDPLFYDKLDFQLLVQSILSEMQEYKAEFLEVRTKCSVLCFDHSTFYKSENSCNHVLALAPDLETIKKSFHKSFIQRNIKKALNSNLTVTFGNTETDLKIFYKLLVMTRKKHGLPPQPFHFYQNLLQVLNKEKLIQILIASDKKTPVASILLAEYKDTLYYLYGGSNSKFLKYRPNHLLLWKAIEWGYKTGISYFDFGRTSIHNEGLLKFKRNWGTEEIKLTSYVYTSYGSPKQLINRSDHHQGLINKIIKKLPSPVLKVGGNLIYRHLG